MKLKIGLLTLTILLATQCATKSDISSAQNAEGSWTEIKSADGSLPVARHEAAFVGVGDELILLGGRRIQPVSTFNLKTKTWSNSSPPPIEVHHFQPIVYKSEVYILGAMTGPYPGEIPLPNILIYNPAQKAWRMGSEIPANRRRGGAGVAINGSKLYLVCGIKDGHRGDHKKWMDVYDLEADTWKQLPDAPRARDHFQAVYAHGKVYALGGRTTVAADNPFKNTIGPIDVYDVANGTWSTLEQPLPTKRAGNFTALVQNEILVFGGESFTQEPAHAEVEALNIHTGRWRFLPPMPVGRHGTGAIIIAPGQIAVSSGSGNRGGGPELSDLWIYTY